MIATDIQPMSVVEDKGFQFQEFVNALDPRYVLPSRRTITRSMLPARYEHVRDELKVQLSCVQAVVLLHPLESATREMSSDKYSKVIPIAKSLQQLTASGECSLLFVNTN